MQNKKGQTLFDETETDETEMQMQLMSKLAFPWPKLLQKYTRGNSNVTHSSQKQDWFEQIDGKLKLFAQRCEDCGELAAQMRNMKHLEKQQRRGEW